MMMKLLKIVSLTVSVISVQNGAAKIGPYNHQNINLYPSVGASSQREQIDSDKVIRDFHRFLNSKIETNGRENPESEHSGPTYLEQFQKQSYEASAAAFNASFQQDREYFNLRYLTGIEGNSTPYQVGTFGTYFGETLKKLPGLSFTPRLTSFWNWMFGEDVKKLYSVLDEKIESGEVLYTNKKRDGGFLYRGIETNPWWHRAMAFCSFTEEEKELDGFGPKFFMCSLIMDFGLTILMKLVFLRDLTICGGITFLTGDTNLCLAYYISKLAFPGWTGDRETPFLAHNVHLY